MIDKEYARTKTMYALKFVTKKMKMLMTDDYGRKAYLSSFNKVFEDTFGIKKFGSALIHAYDSREVIALYDRFNFPLLMTITNTPKFYNGVQDLIRMDTRMDEIREIIRKSQKKGKKKDKQLVKEFEYLTELYKDTVKAIRKGLGVKSGSNYKKRYVSAKDLVDSKKRGYFFDDEDDDFDSVAFKDDDDDFEDSSSEFERYFRMASGFTDPTKKKAKKSHINDYSLEDDDDDFDSDEDEEDEDDEDVCTEKVFRDQYNAKLDRLTQNVHTMATAVQMLVNNQADINQSETYVAHKMAEKMVPRVDADINDTKADITNLKAGMNAINKTQSKIIDNLESINDFMHGLINGMNDDQEDEESAECANTNFVRNDPNETFVRMGAEDDLEDKSTEELIERANQKDINMASRSPVKARIPKSVTDIQDELDEKFMREREAGIVRDPNTGEIISGAESAE